MLAKGKTTTSFNTGFSGPELCGLEAVEIVRLLKAGEISSSDLLDASFERIDAVDHLINAMPTLCPERAYSAAETLNLDGTDHPGWLGGLPLGIKDLDRVEGVRTTFGTVGLSNYVPDFSDHVVTLIEKRGGVVVGKTNTPEMGAGGNTFNDVFGHTVNPWNTKLNSGGSSGGAAAALATGQTWLSLGSDHGGSLRTPAAYCGIVGLRPSPGRVPATLVTGSGGGFIQDGLLGPMGRSVRDCALFLDAISGFEPRSPLSFPPPETAFQNAVSNADEKVRIAFARDLNGLAPVEPVIAEAVSAAMQKVEAQGGTVVEDCPLLPDLKRTYRTIRALGFASNFANIPHSVSQHFKKALFDNWKEADSITAKDFVEVQVNRTAIFLNVQSFLENFDVIACPTVGCMPRSFEIEWIDEVEGEKYTHYMDWLQFAYLATVAGLPAISVPIGFSPDGMPIGLQLIGPPRGEATVLRVARTVEVAVGGSIAPIDPNVVG